MVQTSDVKVPLFSLDKHVSGALSEHQLALCLNLNSLLLIFYLKLVKKKKENSASSRLVQQSPDYVVVAILLLSRPQLQIDPSSPARAPLSSEVLDPIVLVIETYFIFTDSLLK